MTAGGGAQKLLENHAGAESMRFVVLASKIKVRRAWDTLDVEGQPGVASGCSPGAWGCRSWCVWPQPPVPMGAASDCTHHRRRTTAWTRTRSGCRAACSACTHRARTPWPLRRRRARAPTLTVTPNPKPNPSPNTNPKPNPNQASPSYVGRRAARACGCRGPCRCGLIVCLSSRPDRDGSIGVRNVVGFSLDFA